MNIQNGVSLQINSITSSIDGKNIRNLSKEYKGGEEKLRVNTIHDKFGIALNATYTNQRINFEIHHDNVQFIQELQNIENTILDIINRGKATPDNKLFLTVAQQGKMVVESYRVLSVASYPIKTEIITDGQVGEFTVVYTQFKIDVMPDSINATPITRNI